MIYSILTNCNSANQPIKRTLSFILFLIIFLILNSKPAHSEDFYQQQCIKTMPSVQQKIKRHYGISHYDFEQVANYEKIPTRLLEAIVLAEQLDYNFRDTVGDTLGNYEYSVGLVQLQADRVLAHRLRSFDESVLQQQLRRYGYSPYNERVKNNFKLEIISKDLYEPIRALHLAAREIKFILNQLNQYRNKDFSRKFFKTGFFSNYNPYLDATKVFNGTGVPPNGNIEMGVARAVASAYNTPGIIQHWNNSRHGNPAHIYKTGEIKPRSKGGHDYYNAIAQGQRAMVIAGCLAVLYQDTANQWLLPKNTKPIPQPLKNDEQHLTEIVVKQRQVQISVWDHGCEDGDIINLLINNRIVLNNHRLTKKAKVFNIQLMTGSNNLTIEAVDSGTDCPAKKDRSQTRNSAAIKVSHAIKGGQQSWKLREGSSSSARFVVRP